MVYKADHPAVAVPLFARMEDTAIDSCLQGIMGQVYVDHPTQPLAAMAILGDFAFLAGQPSKEMLLYKPEKPRKDFVIMVPENEEWSHLIPLHLGTKAKQVTRYAMKKGTQFNKKMLNQAINALPPGYELQLIDAQLYEQCASEKWSEDFVKQFDSPEAFCRLGIGAVALKNGTVVSGSSSYSRCRNGIEVDIATHPDHRRKGLARACSAKLILECMDRKLYPNWDAKNLWSVSLAQQLGYEFSHSYTAWEIQNW